MDLYTLTIHEALARLRDRSLNSLQLTEAVLRRIEQIDSQVRAYLCVDAENALRAAEQADRRRAEGDASWYARSGRCTMSRAKRSISPNAPASNRLGRETGGAIGAGPFSWMPSMRFDRSAAPAL